MGVVRDTSPCHGEHLCQSYFEIPLFIRKLQPGQENSIFSNSDLDLGPTGMGIVRDTPS
jgi:hypothetical protein